MPLPSSVEEPDGLRSTGIAGATAGAGVPPKNGELDLPPAGVDASAVVTVRVGVAPDGDTPPNLRPLTGVDDAVVVDAGAGDALKEDGAPKLNPPPAAAEPKL